MTVRVGKENSEMRPVNAGAPQGSVLGTYMFNIGTDTLEDELEQNLDRRTFQLNEGDLSFLELAPTESNAHSTPNRETVTPNFNISLLQSQVERAEFVILPNVKNIPAGLASRIKPTWRPRPVTVNKFVDDNHSSEKLSMKDSNILENESEFFKNVREGGSERMFNHITSRTQSKGLKVHSEKTTLLAMSSATSYRTKTHFYDHENQRIDCAPTLKALGFLFNEEATVSDQVEVLCRRFCSRTWALRDLRKAGLNENDLLKVYKSTIRPVIEYSSVIYHPMLTGEQANYIEKQQTRALKNIPIWQ